MSDLKLGQIVTTPQNRDAIHIAVAPIVAGHALEPGDHVGLDASGHADKNAAHCIGIVDPYLRRGVENGETFWLFLYPNTVTGLRHEWTHPAFIDKPVVVPKSDSEKWMRAWAVAHMGSDYYGERVALPEDEAYRNAIEAGYNNHVGPYESARDSIDDTWWNHWEIITASKGNREQSFSCGC